MYDEDSGDVVKDKVDPPKYSKNFCPNCGGRRLVSGIMPGSYFGDPIIQATCRDCGCKS